MPSPTFQNQSNGFLVTVYTANYNKKTKEKLQEKQDGGLNTEQKTVLSIIKKNPGLNATQIKEQCKVTQRTLERLLKELKDQNVITFKGSKKTGGYYYL